MRIEVGLNPHIPLNMRAVFTPMMHVVLAGDASMYTANSSTNGTGSP